MKINIFDKDLNRVLILENRYISCLWAEGYNQAQPFTLELQDTPEIRKKVVADYYVGREDRDTLMIIKQVNRKDGHIIASGFQATKVLADVAFIGTINANSEIDTAIKSAYNQSSKYRHLDFADTKLDVKYAHQISNKSFLELSEKMAQETDTGIKVVKNGSKLIAKFYKPSVTAKKVLSTDFGNVKVQFINEDKTKLKNYAIVLGQGEGANRIRADVDLTQGEDRKELIVDAKDLHKEKNENLDAYKKRLIARGNEKLLECAEAFEIAVAPNADEFMKTYDLGDVLEIRLREEGLKLIARVVRFQQKAQGNTVETTVEIGKIIVR